MTVAPSTGSTKSYQPPQAADSRVASGKDGYQERPTGPLASAQSFLSAPQAICLYYLTKQDRGANPNYYTVFQTVKFLPCSWHSFVLDQWVLS